MRGVSGMKSKKILSLILAGVTSLTLAACGGSQETNASKEGDTPT